MGEDSNESLYAKHGILINNEVHSVDGLPGYFSGKESTYQCRRHRRQQFDPWVKRIHWRRKWQSIPVFFHGWRSLADNSPRGQKESYTTE